MHATRETLQANAPEKPEMRIALYFDPETLILKVGKKL
jgi:hypothetical protein